MRYEVTHTIVHTVEAESKQDAVEESERQLDDEYWHRYADRVDSIAREVTPVGVTDLAWDQSTKRERTLRRWEGRD